MIARRLMFVLAVLLIITALPSMAGVVPTTEKSLVITGDFFSKFAQTKFSVFASENDTWAPSVGVWFEGRTLWGGIRTAGVPPVAGWPFPLVTNAVGFGCLPIFWPPNEIYETRAFGDPDGDFKDVVSKPVAVTIYNGTSCGVFAGGSACVKLFGTTCCPGPQKYALDPREITFGLVYETRCARRVSSGTVGIKIGKLPPGWPARFLWLDNDNPLGAVRITSMDFWHGYWFKLAANGTTAVPTDNESEIVGAAFIGRCDLKIGDADPENMYFELLVAKAGKWTPPLVAVRAWRYPGCNAYYMITPYWGDLVKKWRTEL